MKRDGGVGVRGGSVVELYLSRLLAAHRPIEVVGEVLVHGARQSESAAESSAAPEQDAASRTAPLTEVQATATPDVAASSESDLVPEPEVGPQPETDAAPDPVETDADPSGPSEPAVPAVVPDAYLSDGGLIDRLKEQAAAVSAIQAAQFVTAAEFARRRSDTSGEAFGAEALSEFAADEVAAALTLTRWSAGRLPTSTTTQLKDVLAAEVIAVDPARAEKATAQAAADRAVTCWPVDDGPAGPVGMAELRAVGPAPQILDLMDA